LKLTTDRDEASRGLSAIAELLALMSRCNDIRCHGYAVEKCLQLAYRYTGNNIGLMLLNLPGGSTLQCSAGEIRRVCVLILFVM